MDKVRLGFIGSGFMGQLAHLRNYATIENCELVALAEGRQQTAEAVARRYGIQKVYPNHREMLADADIDAVVAIMGYHLHHAVIPDVIAAGKHVITEKPMCIQVETAKRMAALAEDAGVIYHVGYMKRSDPASRLARQIIERWQRSGECGRLSYIRITMPPGNWLYEVESPINCGDPHVAYEDEAPEPLPEWMSEEMRQLYNSFVNFFIHQVNLLRYLLGEDYEVKYVDPAGRVFVAVSDGGVTCTLEMVGYGLQNNWDEFYKVCFERGKLDLQLPAPMAHQRCGDLRIYKQSGTDETGQPEVIQPVLPQRWAFLEQARHFVECIREGKPTAAPAAEAYKDLEVSEQFVRRLLEARGAA